MDFNIKLGGDIMVLGHKHETIVKESSKKELLEILSGLTDDDYNGTSGENHFVVLDTEFGDVLVSRLERDFLRCRAKKMTDAEIIRDILDSNYSDSYYKEPSIEATEDGNFIFVSIAYLSAD